MSAKYEFIDAQKAQYAIVKMCRWLGVSTSGFYEWRDRPASATARRRERLAALIQWIYDDSDGTYGHRRIHAALVRQGERCSPELVRAIMRELGLVPCQPRPFRGDHRDRRRGAGARPGRTRLHRRRAGQETGRRHHLLCRAPDYVDLGPVGAGQRR